MIFASTPAALILAEVNPSSITWVRLDFPPGYILRGDNAGNGVYEQVIRYFSRQLPHYDMKTVDMSRKRFWHELQNRQNYCEVGSQITNERQQYAHFSIPISLSPPAKIVLNLSSWEALGKPDSVSLVALLSNRKLTGGAVSTRSYGSTLDSVLEIFESDINANISRQVIELDSLFSMLAMNRLDFIIEHEGLVRSFLQKQSLHNLKIVAIEEEGKYHTMHVVCTKNTWGEQVIEDINKVLHEHRTRDSFRQCFSLFGDSFNGEFYRRYKKTLDILQ